MSLTAVVLPLTARLATLFARCAAEPGALLLDSCDDHAGEYDFIFRQPVAMLTDTARWPQQLARAMEQVPAYDGPADLPFQGGLAGAFSYDAGRALEDLPELARADIPLPELAVGIYTQALIQRRSDRTTWLLAPQHHIDELQAFWLAEAEASSAGEFLLTSVWQSNLSATDYADRFQKIQDYLLAGDCYQINLAQRFTAEFSGDPWQAYLRLRERNNAPFSGFMRLEDGAIMSHSPERFLAVDPHGKVETKPIKGTRPRHDDPERDQQLAQELATSEKDRAENVMIVDLLRNDLSRLCLPGSVKVPRLFAVETYPAVHHLVSTVIGQLADSNQAVELLAACFPGGSITGAPKIRAMEIIEELEPHRRSFYCGSLGYFSQHGQADTNIAIRTLVAAQNQIYCWAGGGIVADSECADEYQETLDKVARILPVLAEH
ncbi:aminodeoxychorismate synthase component I [Pseudidiomarina sp.]|uniref:aminodeoxychorismate synthase component I n=1 Tax=Pseudidiomarina sp. TaxID=2081707 RepID=UPI00299E8F0F|nr:aminodeoxychorismate synthase component I [Pseudidiomarina sp.]MDX1706224.1 aminodeoxychorismate synthase component I [Pseudidiomarina sp.]